ncbi:hypothetical protein VXD82_01860 [Mycobacteroides chelonae]|uniref:hypothetical protein n=1 Tax=Mycobacteroides chelonae TaxID=1774 RepID=UPI003204E810
MILTVRDGSELDAFDLVLFVTPEGLIEWSAHRSRAEVVSMLRKVANGIECGTL